MKLTTENLLIQPALSGGAIVHFETLDLRYQRELMHKYDGKTVTVEIREKRKGRSLDANAYCWLLCDKIAAAKGLLIKKTDVYKNAVREYCEPMELLLSNVENQDGKSALKEFMREWDSEPGRYGKFCDYMGESKYDPNYSWVRAWNGTKYMTTTEMSHLIDNLVADAQELGIQTETPDEIARIKTMWGETKWQSEECSQNQ